MTDSFKARTTLKVGAQQYDILSLAALKSLNVDRLPFSLKILLENLLRFEDGVNVTKSDIEALLKWDPKALPSHEIAFTPARVIMQDFTGVPCIVDLAAMREAIVKLGGDPQKVNPLAPAELVIDHSVQVDEYGAANSLQHNNEIEFKRNGERYMFLRWGQTAFSNFKVVPPNTGIVHQVNIERLARVIFADDAGRQEVRLSGHPGRHRLAHHHGQWSGCARLGRRRHRSRGGHARPAGDDADSAGDRIQAHRRTAGRHHGHRSCAHRDRNPAQERRGRQIRRILRRWPARACRSPTAPRSPTCRRSSARPAPFFRSTRKPSAIWNSPAERPNRLRWSRPTPRRRVFGESMARPPADYTEVVELDLSTVEPSLAGPKRPQDRVPLRNAKSVYENSVKKMAEERAQKNPQANGKRSRHRGR